jgi:hypothetical protein
VSAFFSGCTPSPLFYAKVLINIDLALDFASQDAVWFGANPFVFSGPMEAVILKIGRPDEAKEPAEDQDQAVKYLVFRFRRWACEERSPGWPRCPSRLCLL